ncbi:hypothetical protein AAC387_Pa01g2766 [Persea americana]
MLNGENCSGFGWDPHKNTIVAEDEVWNGYAKTHKGAGQWRSRSFPHYEMFSTVSGKNCAIGKGAATTEDVLDELTRNKENEDTIKGKERRSTDNMDGFREAAMIIGNKIDEAIEKFSRVIGVDLDITNKMDKINEELRKKFSRVIGVDLDITNKMDKINEELSKLPKFSRAERHKVLIAIGHDHEIVALFLLWKMMRKKTL